MDEIIKMIVANMLKSWKLTDYAAGTVIDIDPLRVQLHEQIILEPINLICTSETPQLNINDKISMLRVSRGQKYIILGKSV